MSLLDKIKKNKDNLNGSDGKNIKIDSIMIYDNGKEESIFYNEDNLHEVKSISKVITCLAFLVAIDKKMTCSKLNSEPLSIDTKVYPVLKDLIKIKDNNIEIIKKWDLKTLFTYGGGYDDGVLFERDIKKNNVTNFIDYTLNYPLHDSDNWYKYSNADIFVSSVFFQEAFNMNLKEFVNENIFKPLGIKEYTWLNNGKYCAASTGLYFHHKDLFKIGKMILNKGIYDNKQIISSYLIEEMFSMQKETPSAYKPQRVLPKFGVGYAVYISRDGYVFKEGTNGQYFIVNFNKNQLITIFANEKDCPLVTEILRNVI